MDKNIAVTEMVRPKADLSFEVATGDQTLLLKDIRAMLGAYNASLPPPSNCPTRHTEQILNLLHLSHRSPHGTPWADTGLCLPGRPAGEGLPLPGCGACVSFVQYSGPPRNTHRLGDALERSMRVRPVESLRRFISYAQNQAESESERFPRYSQSELN